MCLLHCLKEFLQLYVLAMCNFQPNPVLLGLEIWNSAVS